MARCTKPPASPTLHLIQLAVAPVFLRSGIGAMLRNHEAYGSAWRQRDYDVVTSPEFKKALQDNRVILLTWKELQKLAQQP